MTPQAAERIADLVREEYDSNPAFRAVVDAQLTSVCSWCRRAKHGDQWEAWTEDDAALWDHGCATHGICPECLAEQEQSISVSRTSASPVNSIQGIAGPTGDCFNSLPVDTPALAGQPAGVGGGE